MGRIASPLASRGLLEPVDLTDTQNTRSGFGLILCGDRDGVSSFKKRGEGLGFPPYRAHGPRCVGRKDAPMFFLAVGEGTKSLPVLRR